MPQTFTINEDKVNTVAKKAIYRPIFIFGIAFLFCFSPYFTRGPKDILDLLLTIAITAVLFAFVIYRAYKMFQKIFRDAKITTDEYGIDVKAVMAPYKRIEWVNLGYVEKKNGVIKIFDRTISSTTRGWLGNGVILVPHEINNRNQLIQELDNHINALTIHNSN